MILSRAFILTAERKKFEDTNNSFVLKLNSMFPEQLDGWDEEKVQNYILLNRKRCDDLSIYTERGIFAFLAVGLLLGEGFLDSTVFVNLFKTADISGDQVMEVFFFKLNQSCN